MFLSASASGRTRSLPGITLVEPSGKVIVAVPSLSTSIFVPFGRSGLAFLILSLTLSFSASVKLLGSLTGTLSAGTLTLFLSASVSGRTRSVPGITLVEPSGKVMVAVPSLATSILVPFGRSGLAFLILSLTLSFSASVKLLGSLTGTLSAGTLTLFLSASVSGRTRSVPGMVTLSPSLVSIVVSPPFGLTVIFASSGRPGFSFLMFSTTLLISSGVRFEGSLTGTLSAGVFT